MQDDERKARRALADRLGLCFLLFDPGFQSADQSSQALDAIFQMLSFPERKDGWPPDPRKFRKPVYGHVHCGIDHNWSLLLRPNKDPIGMRLEWHIISPPFEIRQT